MPNASPPGPEPSSYLEESSNLLINSYTYAIFISPELSLSNTLNTEWYSDLSRLKSLVAIIVRISIFPNYYTV